MTTKFRLEDVNVPASASDTLVKIRTVRIDYSTKNQPRCDSGDHCYGCDSAEPKKPQRDIRVYAEAA
jgi:hypothetical protein